MTLDRPSSAPPRQQSLDARTRRNGPGPLLQPGIPPEWVHDRFARALIESYRAKNPLASKDQVMQAVLQTMLDPRSGRRVPPPAQLQPFLERVMTQRTAVSKKMADMAQQLISTGKGKSATKVALEVYNQALKSKTEHDARSVGTPRAPAAARHAGNGMQRPGSAPPQRGPGRVAAAPVARMPAAVPAGGGQANAGGGKANGGKGPHHATPQEAAKKAKEAKAELAKKAKEEKALKEAKQAMQKEVARLMKAPKLTFPERISFPDCDAAFLRSLEPGNGKKNKNKKGKAAKISLLPRLIDLLYYGGLRPDKRRPNPVHRKDIHVASTMQNSAVLTDARVPRLNVMSDFLNETYYRLVLAGQHINTRAEKIVIKSILDMVTSIDPTVSEVTQKFILGKVLGKYQRETLEIERDPDMPKVILENQIPGMDQASLAALDNGRFNEWLERNTYAFGFNRWLLSEFNGTTDLNNEHFRFVMDGSDKHPSITKWLEGKPLHSEMHAGAFEAMMLTHLMESQISIVQSMFGVVYNMLSDVLVALHAPFHRVMLQNFVNLYLRLWNSKVNDNDVKQNLRKDVSEFKETLKAMVPWPAANQEMPEYLAEKSSAILKNIIAHQIGGSDITAFIGKKDLHDVKLAPERAGMYHAFIRAITEEKIRGLQVRAFGHMEDMLTRQKPNYESILKNVTGEYRQVTRNVFQEASNRFVHAKTKSTYAKLNLDPETMDILAYKHDYDSIIRRLGTLVGWIKDVGFVEANAALSVKFLNEQGFVSWPLVDAASQLTGIGNPGTSMFMQGRNMRLAGLMGLTNAVNSSQGSLFSANGRFNVLIFDADSFYSRIAERKDGLDEKRMIVKTPVKRVRSEAYLALLEARKARNIEKLAQIKEGKKGKKKQEVNVVRLATEKSKKEIRAVETAVIKEVLKEVKAEVNNIAIPPTVVQNRIDPILEEDTVPEPETISSQLNDTVIDGKGVDGSKSPRNVDSFDIPTAF